MLLSSPPEPRAEPWPEPRTERRARAPLAAAFLRPAHLSPPTALRAVAPAPEPAPAAPASDAGRAVGRADPSGFPAASRRPRTGLYRAGLKRVFDLGAIALAAPFVLPLVLALALAVTARDGGRPFYVQERLGRGGRAYRMWKLRTMVPDADSCLEACLRRDPALRAEWNSKQKLINDPRVTAMGRWLRRSSLDELPQLWNVVRGDMSLVGPRPMMPSQRPLYPGQDYYALRPGMTGPWQISDRNDSSFADRAKYDRLYNRRLSLRTDLAILAATVRVVVRGTGH